MRSDLRGFLPEMTRRERFKTWLVYYWWPTRRWMPKVSLWWDYNVLRYPRRPPLLLDPIARHFGWVGGTLPCEDGPVCAEHGWRILDRHGDAPD